MTSTAWFSCMADAPTRPGPIRRSSTRMAGVRRGRGMASRMPARRVAQASSASCATPAEDTPQASAWPTLGT